MDNIGLKVENIVAKGEIARFVQFLYARFEKTDHIIVLPAAYGRAASSMLSAQ